jgi:hypothetical protein
MDATQKAIVAFVGAILVALVARLPSIVSIPQSDVVAYIGLLFGGALWVLGFYYGYEATRTERPP